VITEVETGYIAGYLDGEGTIALFKMLDEHRSQGYELIPVVKFCNTHQESLEWIKAKLNLDGKICPRPHYDGRKQSFELSTSKREKVIEILELLGPHLIIKKQQAKLLLEFCKQRGNKPTTKERRDNGTFISFKVACFDDKEIEIFNSLKQLNHRGCRTL